ncbi:MAG: SGNH/GDSL hydrolase family protein [Spirulina sp. SIO3F2]|nr:SGNH/GDSL hydrolase family protein [Spirulina sp. SIO3F2]
MTLTQSSSLAQNEAQHGHNRAIPTALAAIQKIVFLGDSITEAGGERGGYVWFIGQYLQGLYPQHTWQLINAGISGNTALKLRARFTSDVLAHHPQMVVIYVGVNDVWHRFYDFRLNRPVPTGDFPAGTTLADYRAHLEYMITTAQTVGIQVLLLSPTPIREMPHNPENQQLQAYITAGQALAQDHNTGWVNLYEPFITLIRTYQTIAGPNAHLLTTDGVHPNRAGHQVIAHAILQAWGVSAVTLQNHPVDCVGLCNFDV